MGAGDERRRKLARNAAAMAFSNVLGAVISFATVPITLAALGNASYGAMQTMLAIAGVLVMGDLGLGVAVRTKVARLSAEQREEIPRLVGQAMVSLALVGAIVLALAAVALLFVDVGSLLNLPADLRPQGKKALLVIGLAFAGQMPLSALSNAIVGLQLSDRVLVWKAIGNLAGSLGGAATAVVTHRFDATLAVQMGVALASGVGAAWWACRVDRSCIPKLAAPSLRELVPLVRRGGAYFTFQAEVSLISGMDNIVVAHYAGVEAVAYYSVTYRLINFAFQFVYSLGASFWNSVGNALGARDVAWIRTESVRLRRIGTVGMLVLGSGFVATAVPVISTWTRGHIVVSPWLPVCLALYFGLYGHTMIDGAVLLGGARRMRPVLLVIGTEALVNLLASIGFAKVFGYVGVGLGTLVAYAVCDFVPIQLLSSRDIAAYDNSAEKPRLWTRELTALVASIGVALLTYRAVAAGYRGLGVIAALVSGLASLGASLVIVRLVGGAPAWAVFKSIAVRLLPKRAPS